MKILLDIKDQYRVEFKKYKLLSRDLIKKKKETEEVLDKSVYMGLTEATFGSVSKEFMIVNMYSEVIARDDFYNLIIVRNKTTEITDNKTNYLIVPTKNKCGVYLQSFKTHKYDPFIRDFTEFTSFLIRNYIKNNKLKMGDYYFLIIQLDYLCLLRK